MSKSLTDAERLDGRMLDKQHDLTARIARLERQINRPDRQ